MKVLLANTNSVQLKSDASGLQKEGFEILIVNSFVYLREITTKKGPEVIILFINQSEYEEVNSFLSEINSFLGLIIVIAPPNYKRNNFTYPKYEIVQLDRENTLMKDLTEICKEYREKQKGLKEEPVNSTLERSTQSVMSIGTKGVPPDLENTYDFERMVSLLKNDKIKIQKSLDEFLSIIRNSLILTDQAIKTGDGEVVRMAFHDVLNLAEYYGATLLYELVARYKQETEFSKKEKLLLEINAEQKRVCNYYTLLEQEFNSGNHQRYL